MPTNLKSTSPLRRVDAVFRDEAQRAHSCAELVKSVRSRLGHMSDAEAEYYQAWCKRLNSAFKKESTAVYQPTRAERASYELFSPQSNDAPPGKLRLREYDSNSIFGHAFSQRLSEMTHDKMGSWLETTDFLQPQPSEEEVRLTAVRSGLDPNDPQQLPDIKRHIGWERKQAFWNSMSSQDFNGLLQFYEMRASAMYRTYNLFNTFLSRSHLRDIADLPKRVYTNVEQYVSHVKWVYGNGPMAYRCAKIMADAHINHCWHRYIDFFWHLQNDWHIDSHAHMLAELETRVYRIPSIDEEPIETITPQMNPFGFISKCLETAGAPVLNRWDETLIVTEEMANTISESSNSLATALPASVALLAAEADRFNDTINESVQRLTSTVENVASSGVQVNARATQITEFIDFLWTNRMTVGASIMIAICLYMLHEGRNKDAIKVLAIGAIICGVSMRDDLRPHWEKFTESVSRYGSQYGPQGFDDANGISNFAHSASFLAYMFALGTPCNSQKVEDKFLHHMNRLTKWPKIWQSGAEVIGALLGSVKQMLQLTLELAGIDADFLTAFDRYPKVSHLLKEVNVFLHDSAKGLFVDDASIKSRAYQTRITDLEIHLKSDRNAGNSLRLLSEAKRRLERLDLDLETRGAGKDVTRVPPVAMLFIGPPGIGKSYLIRNLTYGALRCLYKDDPIVKEQVKRKQLRDFVFTRNPADKFWEGYNNQPICIVDEVGAVRDVVGVSVDESEYLNHIRMVNDVVYPLPMAHLEKKGTVEFSSKFILGTTNLSVFDIQSLNVPTAYDRRWVKFEVRVNPKFGFLFREPNSDASYYKPDWQKIDNMFEGDLEGRRKFLTMSEFLLFDERYSLRDKTFVEGRTGLHIYDVIKTMNDLLANREAQIQAKREHEQGIEEYYEMMDKFERHIKTPATFYPQGFNDIECPRMFMTNEFSNNSSHSRSSTTSHEELENSILKNHRTPDIPTPYNVPNTCDCSVCTDRNIWYYCDYTNKPKFMRNGVTTSIDSDLFNRLGSHPEKSTSKGSACLQDVADENPTWSTMEIFKEHIARWYRDIHDRAFGIPTHIQKDLARKVEAALIGVGALSTIWTVWQGVKGIWSLFESKNPPQEYVSQFADLTCNEVADAVTRRNVVAMSCSDSCHRGFGFFICDNILIVPRHYLGFWERMYEENPDAYMEVRRLGDKVKHQVHRISCESLLNPHNIYDFNGDTADSVAIYLDTRVMQRFPDIGKYLAPGLQRTAGELVIPAVDHSNLAWSLKPAAWQIHGPVTYHVPSLDRHLTTEQTILYNHGTKIGDCGLPLFIRDKTAQSHRMVAFHIGGNNSTRGVGAVFTRIEYDRIMSHFSKRFMIIRGQMSDDPAFLIEKPGDIGFNELYSVPEGIEVKGKVNLAYMKPPIVPTKTSIIPSPIHGCIGYESKTKPAWLRPFKSKETGEIIDPISKSTDKYHQSVKNLDPDMVQICVDDYTDYIINAPVRVVCDEIDRRVLTYQEAVAGIPGIVGLDGLPRKTSSGYPWSLMYFKPGLKGKQVFFGTDGDYTFSSKEAAHLQARVETIIEAAKGARRLEHIFFDFPKDERRPIEKVESGKTRKISACPVDLAVCIRMYFGAFIQHYIANRISNGSAVGVNVYSDEIDLCAQYIGLRTRVIAGDFSNYDGVQPHMIMSRFLDTVTAYYRDKGSEAERVRAVLFEDIVNTRHISDKGAIYEWVGSNASGNPLTTILNTWSNNIILRLGCLKCIGITRPKDARKGLKQLRDCVRYLCFGDDNLISVVREHHFANAITQESLTEALDEMGFTYTDEEKGAGGLVSNDRDITQCSFLKRKFAKNSVLRDRKFVAALAMETILESIQWTRRHDQYYDFNKDNIQKMLCELALHDEDTFNEWCPRIVRACEQQMDWVPPTTRYRDCQLAILNSENRWLF